MAFIKTHQPCLDADCGSSDGLAYNDDGTAHCYVCHKHFKADYDGKPAQVIKAPKPDKPFNTRGTAQAIADRGISTATAEQYGIYVDTTGTVSFNYADDTGDYVSAKVRRQDKTFFIEGSQSWNNCLMYGQQLFSKGGKYITICEGEYDAASAYQMMGSRYPVVSVKNGAGSAVQDCTAQYEWLNSFDNIIVCFDADEPGKKAADEVAKLFGAKVKIVKHAKGYKDASDYLQHNDAKLFKRNMVES